MSPKKFAGARWTLPLMAAAVLAALAAGCYWNRLDGPFLFDDQAAIVDNASLRRLDLAVFAPPRETPVAGRPLLNLTFALDYARSGLSPAAFHRTNLLLHVACSFMLFLFLRRALRAPRLPESIHAGSDAYAAASALLFCAHPLASEVVLYTSQRSETLVALCYLIVLYMFARDARPPPTTESRHVERATDATSARTAAPPDSERLPEPGSARVSESGQAESSAAGRATPLAERVRAQRVRGLVVALVSVLGVLSKEVFVTAPLAALCFDRAFLSGSFAGALRVRRGFYLAFCPALLLLGVLQLSNPRPDSVRWFELDYLLAQSEIVPRYFATALWPARLTLDYGPLWAGANAPGWPWLVGSALGLVAACVTVLLLPRAGFGALFMLLYLAPSSSLLSIHTEIGAERRFYLPLAALLAYLVVAAGALYHRSWQRRATAAALFALACAALAALALRTHTRAADYASLLRAWQAAVEARPQNARAHYNLAESYRREGELNEAIREYDAALALHEAYPDAHSNLGGVLLRRGEITPALRHSSRATQLAPDSAPLRSNFALALGLSGDASAAVSELRVAARLAPDDLDVRVQLAAALAIAGQRAEARSLIVQVLARMPEHRTALRLLRSLD